MAEQITSRQPPNIDFHMLCDNFDGIPKHVLPTGYRLRCYQPGDEAAWTALHRVAEPYIPITDDFFQRQFPENQAALLDRMYFVETTAGEIVGSTTAWWESDWHDPTDRGRIHWVVVHPAHQGRGLSKPMMTQAMQRLSQSHPSAMLGTSSGRVGAIKVYLNFGFHPDETELTEPAIRQAWLALQEQLQHPLLQKYL